MGIVGAVGFLWVVNLPYPPIRRPVANVAPILLLPSFFSMDRNYRQAIAKVEQADQFLNKATSPTDIELGAEKAKEAQKHLDALPVWFLGYEPQRYCSLFGCSWRFTLDEFEQARKQIGRMDAQAIQEKNAVEAMQAAETQLQQAKQQYQNAGDESTKQAALTQWQGAMDQLVQLPPQTFAGKSAQQKLQAYQRDFQAISGTVASSASVSTYIQAAKAFAMQAAQLSQDPPHTVAQWQEVITLWEQAIAQLKLITSEDKTGYVEAQTLMAEYQKNVSQIRVRKDAEETSQRALQQAQRQIETLLSSVPNDPDTATYNRMAADLQRIISQLEQVQNGTTAYEKAQELLQSANQKLQQLKPQS